MNKFNEKRILCEKLEEVNFFIEEKIHSIAYSYDIVGEYQREDWEGNLLWEDEEQTIPKMSDKWDYIRKEELSQEEEVEIESLRKIQQSLEKML